MSIQCGYVDGDQIAEDNLFLSVFSKTVDTFDEAEDLFFFFFVMCASFSGIFPG